MYQCSAYIPDMSSHDAKRARHRRRQAAYEARMRAGVMLCLVPLGPDDINALVRLSARTPQMGVRPEYDRYDRRRL